MHFTAEESVSRWDEDDLKKETVEEKMETGIDEGSSASDDEGTCRSFCYVLDSHYAMLLQPRAFYYPPCLTNDDTYMIPPFLFFNANLNLV